MPKAFTPKANPDAAERAQFRLSDHIGRTLAITVQSLEDVDTKYGLKDAIKADVTIVDGPVAGLDFGDVLLFQAAVVDALKEFVGDSEPIVARVAEKVGKNGNSYLRLEAPGAAEWDAAQALYVSSPANPAPTSEIPF